VIVARVIRTFRDQGGGSILQVSSLTWQPLGRNHPNAIEGRGDHRHAIDGRREARHPRLAVGSVLPPLRHAALTGSMSLAYSDVERGFTEGWNEFLDGLVARIQTRPAT
jgi:hypothetical protein